MTITPIQFEEMPRSAQKLLKALDIGFSFGSDAFGAAVKSGAYTAAGIFGVTCTVGGPLMMASGVIIGAEHKASVVDSSCIVALGGVLTRIGPGFVKDAVEYYRGVPEKFREWRKTPLTMFP